MNHANVTARDQRTASHWIHDVVDGMRTLIDARLVPMQLRASKEFYEIQCAPETTLDRIVYSMFKSPATKDNAHFLMVLSSRLSLLNDADPEVNSKMSGCEFRPIAGMPTTEDDGVPLLYCAITDGIAVGFPSDPVWEQDQIDVYYNELSSDSVQIGEATETIDNLTRSEHADSIIERHQAHQRIGIPNFNEFWACREAAFPNIIFGPDVENHLNEVEIGHLSAIVEKVTMIDGCAATWRTTKSAMPDWGGKVTPESPRVRNNRALIEARRFSSRKGATEIFEWHARFGGGRIHLRFDAQTKEVEIGYIGKHLPL